MNLLKPSSGSESSNLITPDKAALFAAVMYAITSLTGCVRSSVSSTAQGGGITVIDNGNGKPQVICQPTYTSGPNAKVGKATAVVNGQVYECP